MTLPDEVIEKAKLAAQSAYLGAKADDKHMLTISRIIDAALASLGESGWVMVPAEPTQKMLNQATIAITGSGSPDHDYDDDMRTAWRAMIDEPLLASPSQDTGAK